jgi:hypothetical protein
MTAPNHTLDSAAIVTSPTITAVGAMKDVASISSGRKWGEIFTRRRGDAEEKGERKWYNPTHDDA